MVVQLCRVQPDTGHKMKDQIKNEISRVSQALKPLLEETTAVKRRVVEDTLRDKSQKSPFGRSAVQGTAGHRSSDEGPNKREISRVSQALKPPLEETMEVKRKVVEDTSI